MFINCLPIPGTVLGAEHVALNEMKALCYCTLYFNGEERLKISKSDDDKFYERRIMYSKWVGGISQMDD